MNLPAISSNASHSVESFWNFEYNGDPIVSDKLPFYKVKLPNATPHNDNIYDLPEARQKAQRSEHVNQLHQQIVELKNLPKGWDSYNADPPTYKALKNSLKILDSLFKFQFVPTQIMPSVEGGISFLFTKDIKYADIECDNDGDIFAGMSDRTGDPILWQVSQEDIENNLSKTISKISSFLNT